MQAIPTVALGSFLPGFVGIDQGFYQEEGIDLQTQVMQSNAAIAALLNGQVDLAPGGAGVRSAEQGAPVKDVFFYFNTTLWEMVATPDINSLSDLKGKNFGQSGPDGSDGQAARIVLQDAGFDPATDVTFVNMPAGGEVATLASGAIQAMLVNPDLGAKAISQGFHLVMSVQQVGQQVPTPTGGWVVSQTVLQTRPAVIKAWIRATIKALQFMRADTVQTAAIAARELQLDPDLAQAAIPPVIQAIDPDDLGGFTKAGLTLQVANDAQAAQGNVTVTDVDQLTDVTLLRQAQQELGVPCKSGYRCP